MEIIFASIQVTQRNWRVGILLLLSFALSACGGAYRGVGNLSQLDSKSQANVLPTVVKPGCAECQAIHDKVLPICVQAAEKGQYGESQKAQLKTITSVAAGAATGAAAGLEIGHLLDGARFDTSAGESALIGAGAGALAGLATAFASGAEGTSEKVTQVLVQCMRDHSNHEELGRMWTVY